MSTKKRGRPTFGYFVFDLPSDHEVNGSLVTESDVIKSVLSNKNLGGRLKSLRFTTADTFKNCPDRKYSGIRYVHLGGHGGTTGIGFIGGTVKWVDVGKKLAKMFPQLTDGEQRVLTLSCCMSKTGVKAMAPHLKNHFSAIYYFIPQSIGFSQAMTVWSMFYLKKDLTRPHSAIKQDINTFMREDIIDIIAP